MKPRKYRCEEFDTEVYAFLLPESRADFTDEYKQALLEFMPDYKPNLDTQDHGIAIYYTSDEYGTAQTLASWGTYILRDTKGTTYFPCNDELFRLYYYQVEDEKGE